MFTGDNANRTSRTNKSKNNVNIGSICPNIRLVDSNKSQSNIMRRKFNFLIRVMQSFEFKCLRTGAWNHINILNV
jgi:hypothetical protein